jgi:hypothetical protein
MNALAVARRPGATRPMANSRCISDSGERARTHTQTHTHTHTRARAHTHTHTHTHSRAYSDEVCGDATPICTDQKYLSEMRHIPKDTGVCAVRLPIPSAYVLHCYCNISENNNVGETLHA